jgi:phosphatidylglycerophosphate synthase
MALPNKLTYAEALLELRSAQKSAKGAPAYSRFVNRRAGRVLAAGAYRLGLRPNQVTLISAVFTFSGIALIALARPTILTGGAVCAARVVGYALDAADGQLARLTGQGSTAGEWLDHVIDSVKVSSLHLAVLVALYRHFDVPDAYLLVPIGFQVVAAVMFFAMILNDLLRRVKHVKPAELGRPSTVRSILVVPTDYGLLCLVLLTFGLAEVFVVLYAALFAANAAFLALALVKWFGDMTSLDEMGRRPREEMAR